jgi:lipoprotein-releasing system permease protein
MPLTLSIAARYLRGRRSLLLASTARAALISILLGVAAMVVAMALMTGYSEELQRKLIGGNAAIVAYPNSPEGVAADDMERVANLDGVVEVSRIAYGQGSLSVAGEERTYDVTLRGLDPNPIVREIEAGLERPREGVDGAILGEELAQRLGAEEGSILTLMGIERESLRFRYVRLRVLGMFETGFAEADRSWVIVNRELVRRLGGGATLLEVSLADPLHSAAALAAVSAELGDRYVVTDWREFNRGLFTALRLQRLGLFGVLGLIVVVSTFNVATNLVVLTRERSREIGVLAALGLKPSQIRWVFIACGLSLGVVGAALGVALGGGISWFLTRFEIIRFPPGLAAIYFISSVPFRVQLTDVLAILNITLAIVFPACWVPARRAAAMQPGAALRYD